MSKLELKAALVEVKAAADEPTFEAVVSVFGNIDAYGDRMVKGAFARTLGERGLPPIYWNHVWSAGAIGRAEFASETDAGLLIRGRLHVEDSDLARVVRRDLLAAQEAGAKAEFSFAFEAREWRMVKEEGRDYPVRELTDVELFEVGPVTVGANPDTFLIEAASAFAVQHAAAFGGDAKHGTAPKYIQAAHDALAKAGAKCGAGEADDDDEKAVPRDEIARLLTRGEHEQQEASA